MNSTSDPVRIGALAPLSPPGWVEAGRHLLAGMELAARDINDAGGVAGRPLDLVVRDTAADPGRGAAAVDELARLGVAAVAGEYHSVVARAVAARADALGVPFLCSSAVLDALTDGPSDVVARIAPAQSRGWGIYADFLSGTGHRRVAVVAQESVYWAAGTRILRERLAARGGTLIELTAPAADASAVCEELVSHGATALLLLTGFPEPAVALARAVRDDARLTGVLVGAPAGQPEFAGWDGAGIPFLRYLPGRFAPLGTKAAAGLREVLGGEPSFVAFEGYDTIAVLARALESDGGRVDWSGVDVEATRGRIRFERVPGIGVWQWAWPPVEIARRDPESGRIRPVQSI